MSSNTTSNNYPKYKGVFGWLNHMSLEALNKLRFSPFNQLIDGRTWTKQGRFLSVLKNTRRYKQAAKGTIISDNERAIKALQNKHKGQRCFIIGNGPSLNDLDLTKLKDEFTFGVNGIYLNEEKMGFAPTYYVVEDYLVAEDRCSEINAYNKPIHKFFGNYLNYCIEPDDKTLWMNIRADYSEYNDFPHFSTDALRQLWVGGTVSYISMQLAYYMGFDEVYLIGFDHSYAIPDDVDKHKTAMTSNSDDPNHFDPNYFGKGYRWHDPRVDRMELSYEKAKVYFEQDGRKIYNATAGGHLEVYERVNYIELFRS